MSRFRFGKKKDPVSELIDRVCSEIKESAKIEKKTAPISDARKNLLFTAEMDAEVLGWDQPPRLWALVPDENGGEYLHLLDEGMIGDPITFLESAALLGTLKQEVSGVVICSESWMHPQSVIEGAKGLTHEQSFAYYQDIPSPGDHVNRREARSLVMMDREGNTYIISRLRGEEPMLQDMSAEGRLVDALAGMLGIADWQIKAAKVEEIFKVLAAEVTAGRRSTKQVFLDISRIVGEINASA